MAMVLVSKKSLRTTLVVLSGLVVGGCGDKQSLGFESYAKVFGASAQLSCRLGTKYSDETEKCEPLEFFYSKKTVTPLTISAQLVFVPEINRDSRVIKKVTVKPGDGCIKATAGTPLSSDLAGCKKIARDNNRKTTVLMNLGKVTHIEAPVLYVGEEIFLYEDKDGNLVWKIQKGKKT